MTITTWGLLSKSQEDAETIEEAITRIVAEHEEDPEAHTGEGESLAAHRENEILDHKAGSTVGDKLSMTEYIHTPNLRDSVFWATQQNNDLYDDGNPPMVAVGVDGNNQYCRRIGTFNGFTAYFDYDVSMLVQFNISIQEHDEYFAYLGFLYYNGTDFLAGFGFEIDDDVLKGFYVGASGLVKTGGIAFTPGNLTNLRAQYNAITRDLEFYVNGELAETLSVANDAPITSAGRVLFGMNSKSADSFAFLDVFDVYTVRGVD